MASAWRIREWDQRYEVNARNRAAKPGQTLRLGPLEYIRLPVWGYTLNKGYRRLKSAARTARRLEAAMCLWPKLLQLAGDNERGWRGWLLNEDGGPAEIQDFVYATGFRRQTVAIGLEVLADPKVRWIERADVPEVPGISRKSPEVPGVSPSESDTDTESEKEIDAREDKLPAEIGGPALPPAGPKTTDDDPGAILAFTLAFFEAFPPANPALGLHLPGWSTRGADSHRGWAEWAFQQPPELLRSITAADLKQAKRWGDEKKWGWGPGTLLKYLEQKAPLTPRQIWLAKARALIEAEGRPPPQGGDTWSVSDLLALARELAEQDRLRAGSGKEK